MQLEHILGQGSDANWLKTEGVYTCTCQSNLNPSMLNLKSVLEKSIRSENVSRVPAMLDLRSMPSVVIEVNDILSLERELSAFALVVNSELNVALGNYMLNRGKSSVPSQVFLNKADAIHWLKQYIE